MAKDYSHLPIDPALSAESYLRRGSCSLPNIPTLSFHTHTQHTTLLFTFQSWILPGVLFATAIVLMTTYVFIFSGYLYQHQMINMPVLSFSHFIALKTAASKILKFLLQPIFHPFRFRLPHLHAFHTHAIHRPTSHPTTMVATSFHHLPARLQVLSWTPDTTIHPQTILCIQQHDLPDNFQQQEEKKKNHLPALVSFCTPTNQRTLSKTQRTIGSQKKKAGHCARTIFPTHHPTPY